MSERLLLSELRNSFLQDHRISLFLITLKCGSPHPKVAKILQRSIFIVVGYLQLASIAFLNFVIAFVNVEELVGRLCESLYWCHCHQRYQCYQFHRHVSLSFLRVTCLPSGFVGLENLGVVSLLKAVYRPGHFFHRRWVSKVLCVGIGVVLCARWSFAKCNVVCGISLYCLTLPTAPAARGEKGYGAIP